MFIQVAYVTLATAQTVANTLADFFRNNNYEDYMLLDVVGKDVPTTTVKLRPILEQQLDELVDTSQIVQCITKEGRRVDIVLPRRELRDEMPAGVMFERE